MERLTEFSRQIEGLKAEGIVAWALATFGAANIALASSLGREDQVLTHMLKSRSGEARIFTLDSGRLFQETFEAMETTSERYDFKYELYFPESRDVESLIRESGPNLFYRSVEDRRRCCEIRKVRPLKKALSGLTAWICGLRREQSPTRADVLSLEWDGQFGLYKINPLFDWSQADLIEYMDQNDVPVHRLQRHGFTSIGCAPCTRAIENGEDIRAGRWWWESPEHKECGLHGGEKRAN